MRHPERWLEIEAYADGALGPAKARDVEEHLRSCTDCTTRLQGVRRENMLLRTALAPPAPPPGLAEQVMARLEGRRKPALRPAVIAGVLVNLVTAALLVGLSLNTGASVALMVAVALVAAVLWGGVKGLLFASLLAVLPGGLLGRGLIFGLGIWAGTNALLALSGGFGSEVEFSPSFVLLGSLFHHVLYGVLLSWLYGHLSALKEKARF